MPWLTAFDICFDKIIPHKTVKMRWMIQNKQLICNGKVVLPNSVENVSLLVEDGRITALLEKGSVTIQWLWNHRRVWKIVMPGMIDTHNHMGDPGLLISGGLVLWLMQRGIRRNHHYMRYAAAVRAVNHWQGKPDAEKQTAESRSVDLRCGEDWFPPVLRYEGNARTGCVGFKDSCFPPVYPRITDGYLVTWLKECGIGILPWAGCPACRECGSGWFWLSALFKSIARTRHVWRCKAVVDWVWRNTASCAVCQDDRIQALVCHTTIMQERNSKNQKRKGRRYLLRHVPIIWYLTGIYTEDKNPFAKCTPPFTAAGTWEKDVGLCKGWDHRCIRFWPQAIHDEEKVMQHDVCWFLEGKNTADLAAMTWCWPQWFQRSE